jgi:hypothetical protein
MRLIRAQYGNNPKNIWSVQDRDNLKLRKVFETPGKTWFNEEKGSQEMLVGTSDLDFCTRVIEGGYLNEHWPT